MNLPKASPSSYQSYLLRIWREEPFAQAGSPWRFSLEDPRTGFRRGFQDLELLMDFLNDQLRERKSD